MIELLRSDGEIASIDMEDWCDMSGRKIGNDDVIEIPKTTRALDLSSNQFRNLASGVFQQCDNVEFLCVSKNKLDTVDGIGELNKLTLLDVSQNRLRSLDGIEKSKTLKRLLAASNHIKNVYSGPQLPLLTLLDVQKNPVKDLNFGQAFPNLFELYMDDCHLTSLNGLNEFASLQHFTARRNQIDEERVVKSSSLTNIDAEYNRIRSILPFTGMAALIYLDLTGNPLTDEGLHVKSFRSECMRALKLSKTLISRLSPVSAMFPNIETVDVSSTRLDSIEDVLNFVSNASKLRVLDTRFTPITADLYQETEEDTVWKSEAEYNEHFAQAQEQRQQYRTNILSKCKSMQMEVLDSIAITNAKSKLKSRKEFSSAAERKRYVHEMIEKYERENQKLREIVHSGKGKTSAADRLVRLLHQQNNLMKIEMADVREAMYPDEGGEETYPYVTQLIDSLLEENIHLRESRIERTHSIRTTTKEIEKNAKHHHHSKHRKHHKHKKQEKEKEKEKPHSSSSEGMTYYVPGAPPPATPQYPPDEMQEPETVKSHEFPYPRKKLKWLKYHPLPDENEPCACFETVEKEELQSIKRFQPEPDDRFEEFKYERDTGGWTEPPEKSLPISYPFNTKAIRKLPWDFEEYPPIQTRRNRPKKREPVFSATYCETLILRLAARESGYEVEPGSKEYETLLFWVEISVCSSRRVKEITKFDTSSEFGNLTQKYDDVILVMLPCDNPKEGCITDNVVVYRFVQKPPSPTPRGYLLCAASLGRQAIDRHDSLVPTNVVIKKLETEEFDSLWFRRERVESLLIRNAERIVPLYGVEMK